mmetsp:Transcript_26409/g.36833  ORF Transcript_26409/g.36833 Transcript_26409/m.36833 type:complete len:138 (-) Transcript_26409:103-516(-)
MSDSTFEISSKRNHLWLHLIPAGMLEIANNEHRLRGGQTSFYLEIPEIYTTLLKGSNRIQNNSNSRCTGTETKFMFTHSIGTLGSKATCPHRKLCTATTKMSMCSFVETRSLALIVITCSSSSARVAALQNPSRVRA